MIEWIKCEYGKGVIDRAGQHLSDWWVSDTEPTDFSDWDEAFSIVQNWRACHSLPLNVVQKALRGRAQRIEPKVIIAQRLKRFPSIMNKLAREPHMKLSQMQDLGGCRAILSNIDNVNALFGAYRGVPRLMPEEASLKWWDYISNPKEDGYRGIHVVARYHPRIANRTPWDGHRVEIQLRTPLQHAFATAVETVTAFTREPLKFGLGSAEWRRFFSLMGSALAIREGTPIVPGTPTDHSALMSELRDTASELRVRQRLEGWSNSLNILPRHGLKNFKWILLILDTAKNNISVAGYANRNDAAKHLADIEKSKRPEIDAVLVWVNFLKGLRTAYPNYYADTRQFLGVLEAVLSGK
jgi:ppGpp synthetase/RelA/SpoT-type nucleotidyltranferase